MDNYAVFGVLLMCYLGQALGNANDGNAVIDFTSPVLKGDNVNITCTWTRYEKFVQASWYRQTETANEEILYTFHTSGISAEPGFEFVLKHSVVNEFNYTIKLVGAKKEDTGTYWCKFAYLIGLSNSTKTSMSNVKRLDVTVPETTTTARQPTAIPTPTHADSTTSKGPSIGIVAGSVVGGVLLLAVIVTVSLCICRRRRNMQEDTELVENDVYVGYADDSTPPCNARSNTSAQIVDAKIPAGKEANQEVPVSVDKPTKTTANNGNREAKYADKKKNKKPAAKENPVQYANDPKTKNTARDENSEVQYAQVDELKKERALPEGSHYAQVAPTGDGKKERAIVRTVPETEYSAVKLRTPGDQHIDTDSD